LIKQKQDFNARVHEMRAEKLEKEANQPYNPKLTERTKWLAQKKSITLGGSLNRGNSSSKWDNLHAESKKLLNRQDADRDLSEFEKNRKEYTFQPNSGKKARSPSFTSLRPSTFSRSSSSKQKLKADLNQGRRRLNDSPKRNYGSLIETEVDQTFQVSVSIGGNKK
jgi:hypothetical protein